MRSSLFAPALVVGLVLAWGASADPASAPPPGTPPSDATPAPVAPIFYCPIAPAMDPAHAAPAAHHHRLACPTQRLARADSHRGHWRGQPQGRLALRDDGDVSASQAFIYRYERALGGLDPRAADEAWAQSGHDGHLGPPPPPNAPGPGAWREEQLPPPPQAPGADAWRDDHWQGHADHDADDDEAWAHPAHDGQVAPPPPRVPGSDAWRDGRWRGHADHAAVDALARDDQRGDERPGYLDHRPPGRDHLAMDGYLTDRREAYGARGGGHYGYLYQRDEQASSSGWSYSDVDGRVRERRWSESDQGGGDGQGGYASGWTGRDGHGGDTRWRDRSYSDSSGDLYEYAGRDAQGYLVWPGKTPDPSDPPR
jgi:hypothetical protein